MPGDSRDAGWFLCPCLCVHSHQNELVNSLVRYKSLVRNYLYFNGLAFNYVPALFPYSLSREIVVAWKFLFPSGETENHLAPFHRNIPSLIKIYLDYQDSRLMIRGRIFQPRCRAAGPDPDRD